MAKQIETTRDPWPYDGPIRRADGAEAFNHRLRPLHTDEWWPFRDLDPNRIDSRWNIQIYALYNGTYSTSGAIYHIEENNHCGRPCVYTTRNQAIRTAAARMIRAARASRNWKIDNTGKLEGKYLAQVINWARQIVANETGKPAPRPIHIKEPPPKQIPTGLPLFDCQMCA